MIIYDDDPLIIVTIYKGHSIDKKNFFENKVIQ